MPTTPTDDPCHSFGRPSVEERPPGLAADYHRVRQFSETLAETLEPEDMVVQTMPDVSPAKWHLAHTTWFFETFVLKARADYEAFDGRFEYLFNSYYNAVGDQFPRVHRGTLSRPTVSEVSEYRAHVDAAMAEAFDEGLSADETATVEVGLHHEQQHQELLVTDIKHVLSVNPLLPVYRERDPEPPPTPAGPLSWTAFDGGLREVGHDGEGFAYDNESPRHEQLIRPFELADRCVTNAEWQQFMADGGYDRPELWTSLGWATVKERDWQSPEYWFAREGRQMQFTASGLRRVEPHEPVTHVSWLEADAYARWVGLGEDRLVRLPGEFEWEVASREAVPESDGEFADGLRLHPAAASAGPGLRSMFGNGWEWTSSPYLPYPGYRPAPGAIGEYNGKFMCQQYVLRGGSCATTRSHVRPTYRNFFGPDARWQFTAVRLCREPS